MPAFATHEIFGEEGLDGILASEPAKLVSRHRTVFCLGCQGPDIFFYNPFLSGGKKEINLGSRMHETGTNCFFQVYMEELLQLESRFALETGISYLLGFLSHYSLDTELHPYIYSRVGYAAGRNASNENTLPAHHRLEAVMDRQMLMAKRECMPSAYYPERRILLSDQELTVVAGLMSRTVQRVYRVMVKPRHVRESHWWMRTVMRQVYDHSGPQGGCRCPVLPSARWWPVIRNMVVSDCLRDEMDAMNQNAAVWRSPWNQDRSFDSSVWELYDDAQERFREYVKAIEPILSGMMKRMTLLERKRSRAECVKDALREQLPEAVRALENRNYHSGNAGK